MARLTHRLATEPHMMDEGMAPDEDALEREDVGDDDDGDLLDEIVSGLHAGCPKMAQATMALAQLFQRMVHSASRGDEAGLDHWYRQARRILNTTYAPDDQGD
jgi:hypothetical protein